MNAPFLGLKVRPGLTLVLAWLFLSILCLTGLRAAEDKEAQATAESLLRDRGATQEVAAKVAKALVKADETESVAPLLPLMEDKDLMVAVIAGSAAVLVESKVATAHIVKLLREKRGAPHALLMCLFPSTRRDTVKLLVGELAAHRDDDCDQAAMFSLRVMTGQQFTTAAEWSASWSKQTAKKKIDFPKDQEEMERRAFAAGAVLRSARLRAAVGAARGDDPPAKTDPHRATTELAKLLEQGGAMQLSAAAREGDTALSLGLIKDAVNAYARAQKKDPRDHRSAYLRGCGLFELGRRDEARKIFVAIEAVDPKAVAAYFLARLCKVPEGQPLLPAAREELQATVLLRGEVFGWDDPVLAALLAQQIAGVGPRFIPQEALDELILESPDDVELRCGIAQCRPRVVMLQSFAALRDKFPHEVLPICGWISAARGSPAPPEKAALIAAAHRWRDLEPRNAMPALLALGLQHPRGKKSQQFEPLDDETAAAVVAAARLPDFDNRGRGICQGVRRVLEATDHPFPLAEITHRPIFDDQMFDILSRLIDTEMAAFEAGNVERAVLLGGAADALVERLRAGGGGLKMRSLMDAVTSVTLERRRARWLATGASGEFLLEMENRIDALDAPDKKRTEARQLTLQLLALPSLERELVDEQLAESTPPRP